ncbi:MAG: hypothetical protein OEY33_00410 [Bdellovibrionales bacterium]|nr:hypothetical protein [Bdellovibrionales bacterium]
MNYKRSHHNKNNRNRKRNNRGRYNKKGPYLTPQERVFKKYMNLLDQHIEARRKYFELFFRADPNQKVKLEKIFNNTIEQVRNFENSLNEEEKKLLDLRINKYREDIDYTQNHSLEENKAQYEQIEDPHLLPSQKTNEFIEDTEESIGSIEDYHAYKGVK